MGTSNWASVCNWGFKLGFSLDWGVPIRLQFVMLASNCASLWNEGFKLGFSLEWGLPIGLQFVMGLPIGLQFVMGLPIGLQFVMGASVCGVLASSLVFTQFLFMCSGGYDCNPTCVLILWYFLRNYSVL